MNIAIGQGFLNFTNSNRSSWPKLQKKKKTH